MSTLADFEIVDQRGYFRPQGVVSLKQAVELVDAALAYACDQGLREMVVNVSGLTGFPPPTIFERYWYVKQWAKTVRGRLRVAMVALPELIDPGKFGVLVAANRSLWGDVFVSADAAAAWLDHPTDAAVPTDLTERNEDGGGI